MICPLCSHAESRARSVRAIFAPLALAVALFALVADASDWYVAAPRHQPLFVESARHAELAEGRMNVAELITLLEAMPQDARVYVDSPHMDEATSVDKVVVPVTYGPNAGGQELLVRVR